MPWGILVKQEVLQKRKSFTQSKQDPFSFPVLGIQMESSRLHCSLNSTTHGFSTRTNKLQELFPYTVLAKKIPMKQIYIAFNTFREHIMKSVATVSRTLHEEQTWSSGKALGRNPDEQRPEDVLQHLEQLLIFGLETPKSYCQN